MIALPPGESTERDLSWFDDTGLSDISADGRWICVAIGRVSISRHRRIAPDPSVGRRLRRRDRARRQAGLATVEGQRTLMCAHRCRRPTIAAESRDRPIRGARWFPDGPHFFTGSESGKDSRTLIQD